VSVTDQLLENNAAYAATFKRPAGRCPLRSTSPSWPAWMPGSNVYGILGLNDGEAHVIRNAGGVVTDDEIRSPRESASGCSVPRRSS